jgi:hypothetical protein
MQVNTCLIRFLLKWSKRSKYFFAIDFQFCFKHAITKVQENQVGLKLNGTHQLLVYADYVNLQDDNIDITKKKKNI